MAAAGAALRILLAMEGADRVVTQLRETAGLFDQVRRNADAAGDVIGELRRTTDLLGSSAAGAGGLAATFGALGLPPGATGGAAEALRERLFSDPLAIGTFGRAVVPARLGGPQDSAAILQEAIALLRETTNLEERRLAALRLGITELLPLADLDERRFELLVREGRIKGALVTQELREQRAISDAAQQRLRDLAEERRLAFERNVSLPVRNFFQDLLLRGSEELNNFLGIRNPAAGNGASVSRERIIEENTLALRLMQQELANSGPRGRGAIPPGLRGEALNQAIQSLDLRWGAFSLS